jgi:N-acetylglucosamine kinase-like BadF-type ATPase
LAAGTGAVVIALGQQGNFQKIDGLGPWIGDEGSGAWLGLRGLRAAARAQDGRGSATVLQAAALQQFDTLEQLAIRLSVAPNPARIVASFAPVVAQAAEQGDPVAVQLMQEAALALSELVIAGARSLNGTYPVPVVIMGGMVNMGRVLLEPWREALNRSEIPLEIVAAKGTSVDGARRIAMSTRHIHEPCIIRAGKSPCYPNV